MLQISNPSSTFFPSKPPPPSPNSTTSLLHTRKILQDNFFPPNPPPSPQPNSTTRLLHTGKILQDNFSRLTPPPPPQKNISWPYAMCTNPRQPIPTNYEPWSATIFVIFFSKSIQIFFPKLVKFFMIILGVFFLVYFFKSSQLFQKVAPRHVISWFHPVFSAGSQCGLISQWRTLMKPTIPCPAFGCSPCPCWFSIFTFIWSIPPPICACMSSGKDGICRGSIIKQTVQQQQAFEFQVNLTLHPSYFNSKPITCYKCTYLNLFNLFWNWIPWENNWLSNCLTINLNQFQIELIQQNCASYFNLL